MAQKSWTFDLKAAGIARREVDSFTMVELDQDRELLAITKGEQDARSGAGIAKLSSAINEAKAMMSITHVNGVKVDGAIFPATFAAYSERTRKLMYKSYEQIAGLSEKELEGLFQTAGLDAASDTPAPESAPKPSSGSAG